MLLAALNKKLNCFQFTCLVITSSQRIGGGVGVGVADAGGGVQEQHVGHCNPTKKSSKRSTQFSTQTETSAGRTETETSVPGVGVQVERPPVGVDPERAELLGGAVPDGGAPGPAVEPEHERRGRRVGGLDEPVEERAPGGRVDGDVPGVHGEVDPWLPRQGRDSVRGRLGRATVTSAAVAAGGGGEGHGERVQRQ